MTTNAHLCMSTSGRGYFFCIYYLFFLSPAPESEFFLDFTLTRIRRCNSQRRYNHCHKAIQHGLKFFFFFFLWYLVRLNVFSFVNSLSRIARAFVSQNSERKYHSLIFPPIFFFLANTFKVAVWQELCIVILCCLGWGLHFFSQQTLTL